LISEKRSFDNSFEVFLADTPESKRKNFEIRYRVYCEELSFEDKDAFPDKMEYDEWDECSDHFIVRHRNSGEWIGAMRLVRHNNAVFPFQEKCSLAEEIAKDQRHIQSIEISRVCVVREARRFVAADSADYLSDRSQSANENSNVTYLNNLRINSRTIMWGLYRAAAAYSAQNHISHWYFLVARALASCIKREKFEMRQVGSACEHRGERTPYQMSVQEILANPLWLKDYKQDYRLYSKLESEAKWKREANSRLKYGS